MAFGWLAFSGLSGWRNLGLPSDHPRASLEAAVTVAFELQCWVE